MTILIAKQNQPIFLEFDSKIKFIDSTQNTCTFKISPVKFNKLMEHVRSLGFNPFALMYW